jgi:hypothetical protein
MKPMLHDIPSSAVSQLSTRMEFKDFAEVMWKVSLGAALDSCGQYSVVSWLFGLVFLTKSRI